MRFALPAGLVAPLLFLATGAAALEMEQQTSVVIDPDAGTLKGSATLFLQANGSVRISLGPAFRIASATLDGRPVAASDRDVDVALDGANTVALVYRGVLQPLSGDAPARTTGALGDASGVFLSPSSGWLPEVRGTRFRYRVSITVPEGWRAVMPGQIAEEADVSGHTVTYLSETPADGAVLAAGPYEVSERIFDNIRLRTWFEPEVADLADAYLDDTRRYIDLYSRWIGAYPFSAFHVVSGPLPVGLGFPGMTYIGTRVLKLPFIRKTSLGHEVLHNWWGNGVFPDYARGNWAEGLTTFMADYTYALQESEAAAREMRFAWLRDYRALPPERDGPVLDFVYRRHGAAQVVGYHKAAFIFHMLRRDIGTDAFDAGIRTFWNRHRFQVADWQDLRRAFEEASGADLTPFFTQWTERTGAPRLELLDAAREPADAAHRVRLRLAQSAPPYRLSVPIRIATDAGEERRKIQIENLVHEVILETEARPRSVAVDPDADVFRHLDPAEAPPILRDVMLHPRTRIVTPDGDPAARTAASRLALAMLDVPHPGAAPPPEGAPVLAVGTGAAIGEFLSREGLHTPPGLAGRGTARAWATRSSDGTAVVVVAADTAAELEAIGRPLPHYGRRGFVVFEGGRAVDFGGWPVADGPLVRSLD